MQLRAPPLANHVSFRADTTERLVDAVETHLKAHCVQLRPSDRFDSKANRFVLRKSELWYCSYGLPLAVRFSDGDYLRVQFGYAGAGATNVGGHSAAVTSTLGCISRASAVIDFGAGFEQLVWRIPSDVIRHKLSALTGRIIDQPVVFDSVLNFESAAHRELLRIVNCLLITIEQIDAPASELVLAEMEQALLVALLCRSNHNFRHLIDGESPTIAPWQVRRVEAFIESNWNQPLTVEKIAQACESSERSIHRTFRKVRGYTPMEFAKRIRLQNARSLIEDDALQLNVTQVAHKCGYNDVSHFSRDFSKAHGIAPSVLARRGKR